MAKDPQAVAQKWASRLGAATQAITDGVQAVNTAPGVRAAQQVDVWLARLQASRDKWARNVSAVSLQQWQNAMTTKGIQRVASGASAAVPKMTAFMSQWLPYVEQGAQSVRQMPKTSIEDGVARAAAMIRYNAQFQRRPYTGV